MTEPSALLPPTNLPDGWEYQPCTNSVICGGCLFRYGADHPDGDGKWTCPNCGDGNGSAAPASEPVAWTNEYQLGYLKDPLYCGEIPMAMWATSATSHAVPLYAAPVPQAHDTLVEECAKIAEGNVEIDLMGDSAQYVRGYNEACRDIAKAIMDAHSNKMFAGGGDGTFDENDGAKS